MGKIKIMKADMSKQERIEHCVSQLEEILGELERPRIDEYNPLPLDEFKIRVQIYAALLNFYSR